MRNPSLELDFTPSDKTKQSQQRQILEWLKYVGGISTIDAREGLGILQPAARVFELRRLGYPISTIRDAVEDSAGRVHAVAVYILKTN